MALDHPVEANIILRKSVNRWPVSPHAGTGKKLMSLYRLSTTKSDKLSRMLGELLHRLQARGGGGVAFRFSRDDWCVALLEWSFEREEPLQTDNFVVRQGAPGFV